MLRQTDQRNAAFWDELCGSTLASALGLDAQTADALARYDAAYLEFYPYLLDYVRPDTLAKHRVLEIGLGYGTVGQRIAAAGAKYVGVDIAEGPARMMARRLAASGRPRRVIRASACVLPFASASFDDVVSIGCLHHTGQLERSIDEVHRVLREGGRAVIMLYNQFSYRQWLRSPLRTIAAMRREMGAGPAVHGATEAQRRLYDVDSQGRSAPETVFVSERGVRRLFRRFSSVETHKANCDDVVPGGGALSLRRRLLGPLGSRAGLDLYVVATR